MEKRLYLTYSEWATDNIMENIVILRNLILWNYMNDGSLVMHNNNEIRWDMNLCHLF